MYELLRGPLATASFIIFFLGIIYQIIRFFTLTRKYQPVSKVTGFTRTGPKQKQPSPTIQKLAKRKGDVMGMEPNMAVITTIFHILVIVTPVFLLSHNILILKSWGFSLPSFSESFSDFLTLLILGFGVFFLYRRIILAKVRSVSSLSDYLTFLVAFLPFITGFIAYHQFFAYKYMIILHMLTGEIMLVCLPFTKLVHMLYFFLNRFFLVSEYNFGPGGRVW